MCEKTSKGLRGEAGWSQRPPSGLEAAPASIPQPAWLHTPLGSLALLPVGAESCSP